jgi:colicin import membrane protein
MDPRQNKRLNAIQCPKTLSYLSSEYEFNVSKTLEEKFNKLQQLQNNKDSTKAQVDFVKMEIETLESLYDNYNNGMNYFRRAQGGRNGLREVHDKT